MLTEHNNLSRKIVTRTPRIKTHSFKTRIQRLNRAARNPIVCAMSKTPEVTPEKPKDPPQKPAVEPVRPKEYGGPTGPEPTRYGDWEHNGKVSDF